MGGGSRTYVDVPNALVNVIGASAAARLSGIAANGLVPLLRLKVPDGAGEEARRDEIQETRGRNKENLQLRRRAALVEQPADEATHE